MISLKSKPQHVAIVLDGNRRWAKKRFLPNMMGHKEGVKRTEELIDSALMYEIPFLTLFIFSKENWNRPKDEVNGLLSTLEEACEKSLKIAIEKNVKIVFHGDIEGLGKQSLIDRIKEIEKLSASHSDLTLQLALNYSGRWEIMQVVKKIATATKEGKLNIDDIDEQCFSDFLLSCDIPPPDLFIRTSSEYRISNFMLWQLAYTELYFTSALWPDFTRNDFEQALKSYAGRSRRFGK